MERQGMGNHNRTFAFNSRHLSQAIPTRWRFIVTSVLDSGGQIREQCLLRG